MKMNLNEATLGGVVAAVIDENNGFHTVWISHQLPKDVKGFQPKPVQARLHMESNIVVDFNITKGTSIVASVEISTIKKTGKQNSQMTITQYDVIELLSVSYDGLAVSNNFFISGSVGKVEDSRGNPKWKNISVAISKGKNTPTHWLSISVHQSFLVKIFKDGVRKGDWICIKATNSYLH